MKHYGKHQFPQEAEIQLATIFDAVINNKLNIPLHRDITSLDFGDLFIESNEIKFVNFEKYVVQLLSLFNNDLIKSFFVSEIAFDYLLNFGKSIENTESFHDNIDLYTDLIQHEDVDRNIDMTSYEDSSVYVGNICIELYNFNDSVELLQILNLLQTFKEVDLSLRFSFYNVNNLLFDNMLLINDIIHDAYNDSIKIYVDSSTVNNDITDANSVRISVYNIEYSTEKYYDVFPFHKHLVEELSDLDNYTNKPNGYPRLIDNINFRLPFNWQLWLVYSRIENSLFIKEQVDEFRKSNCFTAEYNSNNNVIVNYESEEVVMQDNTVTEYTYTDMTIDFFDEVDFRLVSNNQKLNNSYENTLSDTTQYKEKYICEFLTINMNNIINPNVVNVDDILDMTYTYIDKTDVESGVIKVYDIDINNNILKIFNGYYDVDVLQASPTTIPSVILKYNNLCKDDFGKVFVTKPKYYKNLQGKKSITFDKDSDLFINYDNESSSMTIDVFRFNVFRAEFEYVTTLTNNDSIFYTINNFYRGLYEFRASNDVEKYNIYVLERV